MWNFLEIWGNWNKCQHHLRSKLHWFKMSVYVTFGLVSYKAQLHLISTLCAQINAVDPKGKISSIYYHIKKVVSGGHHCRVVPPKSNSKWGHHHILCWPMGQHGVVLLRKTGFTLYSCEQIYKCYDQVRGVRGGLIKRKL